MINWLQREFSDEETFLLAELNESWGFAYKKNGVLHVGRTEAGMDVPAAVSFVSQESSRHFRHLLLVPSEAIFQWREEVLPLLTEKELESMLHWETRKWFGYVNCKPIYGVLDKDDHKQRILIGVFNEERFDFAELTEMYVESVAVVSGVIAAGHALSAEHGVVVFPDNKEAYLYRNRLPYLRMELGEGTPQQLVDSLYEEIHAVENRFGISLAEFHILTNSEKARIEWEALPVVQEWFAGTVREGEKAPFWQALIWPAFRVAERNGLAFMYKRNYEIIWARWREVASKCSKAFRIFLTVLALLSFIYAGHAYWQYHLAQSEYEANAPTRMELEKAIQKREKTEKYLAVLTKAQAERLVWSKYLVVLADTIPKHTQLDSIRQEGNTIYLRGTYLNPVTLNDWKKYLSKRLDIKTTVKYERATTLPVKKKNFLLTLTKEHHNE